MRLKVLELRLLYTCGILMYAVSEGGHIWTKFGASVTAVTIASSHIPSIAKFCLPRAGVPRKSLPYAYNVVEFPGQNRFDAVVAFESSCHMPRQALFQRLAGLLRPGGRLFIADYFLAAAIVDRG